MTHCRLKGLNYIIDCLFDINFLSIKVRYHGSCSRIGAMA